MVDALPFIGPRSLAVFLAYLGLYVMCTHRKVLGNIGICAVLPDYRLLAYVLRAFQKCFSKNDLWMAIIVRLVELG